MYCKECGGDDHYASRCPQKFGCRACQGKDVEIAELKSELEKLKKPKADRRAYMKEYMRKRRANA